MKPFWQALLAAAIGGAATALASALTDPHVMQEPKKLGPIAAAGAVIGIGGLFKQSPVSPKDGKQ